MILSLLFCQTVPAGTKVYRWTDAKGKTHYTDKPVNGAGIVHLQEQTSWYRVDKVFDGDTIQLQNGKKIRLSGINAPEIESRYRPQEPGGETARLWLAEQLENQEVRLQLDVDKIDKYKRTLAHLFTRDGRHINLELVKRGLAVVNIHNPNFIYANELLSGQEQAEAARLGIWGMEVYRARPYKELDKGRDKGWMRLTGQIKNIKRSRHYTHLEFSPGRTLRIANENLPLFPDLDSYLDRNLEVRGWASRYRGGYSVLVRHPSALKLL